jgi:hypothetical protein
MSICGLAAIRRDSERRITPTASGSLPAEIVAACYYDMIRYFSGPRVVPPFLTGLFSRTHAASFSFCTGVIPPMPMLGLWLLYVHSNCMA